MKSKLLTSSIKFLHDPVLIDSQTSFSANPFLPHYPPDMLPWPFYGAPISLWALAQHIPLPRWLVIHSLYIYISWSFLVEMTSDSCSSIIIPIWPRFNSFIIWKQKMGTSSSSYSYDWTGNLLPLFFAAFVGDTREGTQQTFAELMYKLYEINNILGIPIDNYCWILAGFSITL